MATGAMGAGNTSLAEGAVFIPEIWSDEIIASYETKMVMGNLVRKMNFVGKKGDTVHIPSPLRGEAAAKAAKTAVTIQYFTDAEVLVLIDQHYEYSRMIEDILGVQALSSHRRFITEDAGYALARQKDSKLIELGRFLNGGDGTDDYDAAYIGTDGATLYDGTNGAALTDAGIRRIIQRLDDNDVPEMGRSLVVPPSERNNLMGLDRFTEQSFVGEVGSNNTIRNGRIGDIYGVETYVTPQADTSDSNTDDSRIAMLFHKDTFVCVDQMGVRSQTQYKQEYLADLLTSDHLYGVKCLRPGNAEVPTSGFAIAVG